jgi:DNA-directed RNA polymerase specialized sigma subunit
MDEDRFQKNFELAYTAYQRKMKTFARHCAYTMPVFIGEEDIEAELCIVLARCVKKYHPDNGARFNSYVQQCFKNRIASMIASFKTQKRLAEIIYLDDETVRSVMENMLTEFTAEDMALMHLEIHEWSADIPEDFYAAQ